MSVKEKILEYCDPRMALEPVPVPEWDCTVHVRRWSGTERDEFERDFGDVSETVPPNLRARVLVRFLLDESGHRIFEDRDAAELGAKAADVISRLFVVVMNLSGFLKFHAEDAKKN